MRKESIPLLGIDERPLERQMAPGLADQIENLIPNGDPEDPYWEPVDLAQTVKNASDVPMPASASRVRMWWHSRSFVGKYGDASGSLRRIVSIDNTGLVEVIDPDINAGWETVVSYQVTSAEAGDWDMQFTQMYDMGYITVSKGGKPAIDLILEDDLLIEFNFPDLPVIHTFMAPTLDNFSDEENQAGSGRGFYTQGSVYIRYAFRLSSGELVRHSLPEQVLVHSRSLEYNHQLMHNYYGFKTDPDNYDFWKDKIKGVSILCSEFQATNSETFIYDSNDQLKRLADTAWFEIASFDFLDPAEVSPQDRCIRNEVTQDTISANIVADVDDNSHHLKRHRSSFVYNSRMILGGEQTLFGSSVVNPAERVTNMFVYCMDGDAWRGSLQAHVDATTGTYPKSIQLVTDPNLMAGIPSVIAENGVDLVFISNSRYAVTAETAGWTATIQFGSFGSIQISQSDFQDNEEGVIYHTPTGANEVQFRMEVDLETDLGNYTRVDTVSEAITVWRSPYVSRDGLADYAWLPKGSVIGYPDLRAKEIRLYWLNTGSGEWRLSNTFKLKGANRANYAVHYTTWVDLYSNSATLIPSANQPQEYLPSKVSVSNVNNLLSYPSDQSYIVGSGNAEITGFAVNAIAISEGQYGQYPLYVFKSNGVWSLEQSSDPDIVFSRVSPIDTNFGANDQSKINNVDETIFYVNRSGIYMLLGGDRQEISKPIRSQVKNVVALGAYVSEDDKYMIAVLSDGSQYWFSVNYSRWFKITQPMSQIINDEGNSYFVDPTGALYDMQDRIGDPVSVVVNLPALHWRFPDTLKRIHWIYGRAKISGTKSLSATAEGITTTNDNKLVIRPRWKSSFNCTLRLEAQMSKTNEDYLHRFEAELETRYTDRVKQP